MIEAEYAKAIYELALEEKKEDIFEKCFSIVISTLENEEYYKVLTSPFIEATEKKNLITKVYEKLDQTFVYFLCVLVENNRISCIHEIYEAYNQYLLSHRDIVHIQIESAVELTSLQMINLTESLQNKYIGKKIELENIIDPKLIGGIHIVSNGKSIDMSLKNSLTKLKDSL